MLIRVYWSDTGLKADMKVLPAFGGVTDVYEDTVVVRPPDFTDYG